MPRYRRRPPRRRRRVYKPTKAQIAEREALDKCIREERKKCKITIKDDWVREVSMGGHAIQTHVIINRKNYVVSQNPGIDETVVFHASRTGQLKKSVESTRGSGREAFDEVVARVCTQKCFED